MKIIRKAEMPERVFSGEIRKGSVIDLVGSLTIANVSVGTTDMPPGRVQPIHYHDEIDEITFILEGEVTVWEEKKEETLYPGDMVYFPREKIHTVMNNSNSHARTITFKFPYIIEDWHHVENEKEK
ncbi:MAG: cupin domain-containing protein [Theionarchaea archaeon]|nr:cupin domain-containing protein [Theionarchaea archaeon]